MKKLLLAGVALVWAGGAEAARFLVLNVSAVGRAAFPDGPFYPDDDDWYPIGYYGVAKINISDSGTGFASSSFPPYGISISQGHLIDNYMRNMYSVDGSADFVGANFATDPIESAYETFGSVRLTQNPDRFIPRYDEELSIKYTAYLFEAIDPVQSTFTLTRMLPEPGTWAMLITGFGIAGSVLRRRRKIVLA